MATTNAEYRQQAVDALDKARAYAVNSPARQTLLAEAQVLALLALDAPQPVTVTQVFPEAQPADATPAPAPKRRTRKSPAAKPAADADVEAAS